LRREEVAVLAGVGTSWYTWLEQGRDIKVSESVVRAVSRALGLDDAEEKYLFGLAGISLPNYYSEKSDDLLQNLQDTLLMDDLLSVPAIMIDRFWGILAVNDTARGVFDYTDLHTNALVTFFTNPVCRVRYINWEEIARATVAQYRADMVQYFDDGRFHAVVEDLRRRSPEFVRIWDSHEVRKPEVHVEEIEHPGIGRLAFDVHLWKLSANDNIRLVLHVPNGGDTKRKIGVLLRSLNDRAPISLP